MASPASGPIVTDIPARVPPWWQWLVAAAAVFALSLVSVTLSAPGSSVAAWWPASGVSVLFVLMNPPRRHPAAIAVVVIASIAANVVAGRDLPLTAAYGLASALEIVIVVYALRGRDGRFTLRSLRDATRFVLATALASLTSGIVAGVAAGLLYGIPYLPAATTAAASHAAAILLIAPFALLPPALREPAGWLESIAQSALTAAAVVIAFRPGGTLPLGFLVFAFLAWGALRFPIRLAFAQSLVVCVAALTLTRLGDGTAEIADAERTIVTVVFMASVGIFTVLLVAARYEMSQSARQRIHSIRAQADAERAHAAALAARLELKRRHDDFVATTSHELRTPITSIAGYTELLLDSPGLDERQRAWLDVIERNTTRLSVLVEDLLALGRASASKPNSPPQALLVRELADDAVTIHRPAADAKGITLAAGTDATTAVLANSTDMRRALSNLVSNAVKFTPPGGWVTILSDRQGADVVVSVVDSGPGMAPEDLAHAFERFYRGADAETENTPGAGLGLSIVRELAGRNGGTVSLLSPPGSGLTASLHLPAAD